MPQRSPAHRNAPKQLCTQKCPKAALHTEIPQSSPAHRNAPTQLCTQKCPNAALHTEMPQRSPAHRNAPKQLCTQKCPKAALHTEIPQSSSAHRNAQKAPFTDDTPSARIDPSTARLGTVVPPVLSFGHVRGTASAVPSAFPGRARSKMSKSPCCSQGQRPVAEACRIG